ncbi:MAG: hypothetical protein WBF17_25590 [Phycisphaerae bacterium]
MQTNRIIAGIIVLVMVVAGAVGAQARQAAPAGSRELTVHVCQANNESPYAFVRAKFEPGEVSDPWAVRFLDGDGREVPYFVWDSVTWQVAREGRPDWGHRYALLNHGPGNAPEVLEARGRKLAWAKRHVPELGARLAAEDAAAARFPRSVCAAIYLLRYSVPAYGKGKLTLRLYPEAQVKPKRRDLAERRVGKRTAVQAGELRFGDLPDRLSVSWKGKELYRYAGFEAGGASGEHAHVDPSRPFALHVTEGLITKVYIEGKTNGREGGQMDWQCTYWLFPEGGYAGLEGFSTSNTDGFSGKGHRLSICEAAAEITEAHGPLWETDWWLHQVGDRGFVATHLFHDVPLTVGYGNNPFTVNPDAGNRAPQLAVDGRRVGMVWHCSLKDAAIRRLFAPQESIEWAPKTDWLYRQYAIGVGKRGGEAEAALRQVIGAAAGWIDRPFDEERIAAALVGMVRNQRPGLPNRAEGPFQALPYLLNADPTAAKKVLAESRDTVQETERWIREMRGHVARGGDPVHGRRPELAAKGIPCEGWIDNPAYHASWLPTYTRFREHFALSAQQEHRDSVLRYADFSLEHMAGEPVDFDKLRAGYLPQWPTRFVMIIPLMLHAYTLKPDDRYRRAAVMMFDELMEMVERNPQGYWGAWTFRAKKKELFDSTYNPVGYQRGITAFWAEGLLDLIGRERAERFTAAQGRYMAFSGQLSDSLEVDNVTAIRATTHGGHPNFRNQISLYLYDDFGFYRGLIGNLVLWSAANGRYVSTGKSVSGSGPYRTLGLHYYGAWTLRWALGIGRGTHWLEHDLQKLPDKGFRVRIRNGLPWTKPCLWFRTDDLGLPRVQTPKGASNAPVVWLRLNEPAYRKLAELEITKAQDGIHVRLGHRMSLRLHYSSLRPEWKDADKLALSRRAPDGSTAQVPDGVQWGSGLVEWEADPGEYVLKPR